jgi:hypothetical protein
VVEHVLKVFAGMLSAALEQRDRVLLDLSDDAGGEDARSRFFAVGRGGACFPDLLFEFQDAGGGVVVVQDRASAAWRSCSSRTGTSSSACSWINSHWVPAGNGTPQSACICSIRFMGRP